jgi:uroporphyrin-3 C-methyltransferase
VVREPPYVGLIQGEPNMSKDDKKTSKPPAASKETKSETPNGNATWPGFVAILSLLLVVAGFAGVYYLTQSQKAAIEKQAIDFQGALSATQTFVMDQQKTLLRIQGEIKEYQKEDKAADELLSEAEYLVRLAMFNLSFEANTETAYQLLQAADEKIQAMGATLGWPIRQALAKEMAAVNAVPKVDLPGIVSQLNALSQQVEFLPRASTPAETLTTAPASTSQETSTWKEKLHKTGDRISQVISSLFVISYDVPEAAPLLPPDQYVFVITNIQSKLAMAEWAALYRQPEIYQQSLAQAIEWIRRYFADNNSQTGAFIKNLDELMTISVKPKLPDLSASLKQIEIARGENSNSDVEVSDAQENEEDTPEPDVQPEAGQPKNQDEGSSLV